MNKFKIIIIILLPLIISSFFALRVFQSKKNITKNEAKYHTLESKYSIEKINLNTLINKEQELISQIDVERQILKEQNKFEIEITRITDKNEGITAEIEKYNTLINNLNNKISDLQKYLNKK